MNFDELKFDEIDEKFHFIGMRCRNETFLLILKHILVDFLNVRRILREANS